MEAAWLGDPTGAHEMRYWNGSAWTEHVSDAGTPSVGPLPEGPPPPPPAPAAPAPPPPPPPPPSPAEPSTPGAEPVGADPIAPPGGKLSWKDKLKVAAQQAAQQGKAAADKAKTAVGEQQARRTEQLDNDPDTLWHGGSHSAATKATGMSKAHYRITKDRVWIESGLLGVKSEQVPLWSVKDIDVRQNVLQRGKDIGDVVLLLDDAAFDVNQMGAFNVSGQMASGGHGHGGATTGEVVLDNIEGPYQVRDLLMPLVGEARSKKVVERQSQYLHVNPGAAFGATMGGGGAPAAPAGGAEVDVADQLRKLAQLRDDGILSDEEFAAQKARLLGG